jgi:hypothetical protein
MSWSTNAVDDSARPPPITKVRPGQDASREVADDLIGLEPAEDRHHDDRR